MPPVAEGGQAAKRGGGGRHVARQPIPGPAASQDPGEGESNYQQGEEPTGLCLGAGRGSRGPAGRTELLHVPFILSAPGTNTQSMLDRWTDGQMHGWMNSL